jgi:hypothetical protein
MSAIAALGALNVGRAVEADFAKSVANAVGFITGANGGVNTLVPDIVATHLGPEASL